eukprot:gene4151-biopygen10449
MRVPRKAIKARRAGGGACAARQLLRCRAQPVASASASNIAQSEITMYVMLYVTGTKYTTATGNGSASGSGVDNGTANGTAAASVTGTATDIVDREETEGAAVLPCGVSGSTAAVQV